MGAFDIQYGDNANQPLGGTGAATRRSNKAQRKIYEMLTTGGSGINPLVEDQIWQRDRQRILNDAMRAEEENMAVWAARRYPMPPGAAMYQSLQIRRDAADKIAESSRTLSIKQMEIEIENVKFAIEASIKLYAAAMSAASMTSNISSRRSS